MNVFKRVIDIVNATRQRRVAEHEYKIITGAILSLSGDGAEPVHFDDVKGAFSRLYDTDVSGDFVTTVTRTPASRAQYYRIVPDRVVERVCEVRVREADT